jgi:hypothetical protein
VEYPVDLLAREPAPPYHSEGPFALWHFSEDPSLRVFRPHIPASNPTSPPLVWAIDTRHAPMFWFPRDCPRCCAWRTSTTTAEDREEFFGQTQADRIHVIESDWLANMAAVRLYAYRLPTDVFRAAEVGGVWVSDRVVEPEERVVLDDVLALHREAKIELRITPSVWPFWRRVTSSSLGFSGWRLRNASPDPDRAG